MTNVDVKRLKNNHAMRAWRHGMTSAQLDQFFDTHGRKCAICDMPEDWTKRSGGLVIDHDHGCCATQGPRIAWRNRPSRLCGKCARGLLCYACNAALGQLAENPERFNRALRYLESTRK